jgi:hypothetical protein
MLLRRLRAVALTDRRRFGRGVDRRARNGRQQQAGRDESAADT